MAHLTIAASEATFKALFDTLRDNFRLTHSDSADFGPFSASYAVDAHLEGGTVEGEDGPAAPDLSRLGDRTAPA